MFGGGGGDGGKGPLKLHNAIQLYNFFRINYFVICWFCVASIDQQPFWARAHNKVCKQKGDNHHKVFSGAKVFRLEATSTDCFVRPSVRPIWKLAC